MKDENDQQTIDLIDQLEDEEQAVFREWMKGLEDE